MNTMKSIRPVTKNQRQMALKQFLNDYLILIGIVILTVYTCIVQPSFLAPGNLLSLVRQFVPLGMVSLGMTLVVIGGYIDLSVAGIFSFMGIVSAMLLNRMGPSSLIIVLIAGAACGLLNAVILVKCGARDDSDALFITFGMQTVFGALALIANNGNYVALEQSDFTKRVGSGSILGIPTMLVMFIVVTAILQFVMKKMPIGRSIHLAGGNPVAAELCGISVKKIIFIIYILTGVLTALGAFISTCRIGSALPIAGRQYETNAILSVTIGGTSLSGGKGSVLNTVLGVALFTVMANALNILGIDPNMQNVWKGVILVAAIWLDSRRTV
ncbi:ABC transporter permease [Butyricicoccus sp.]|uniref:ABC transporter permease n=1 Tax=Butyricicoccus sp. TaxID=2049021 RepID=UPI003F167A85